MERPTQFLQVTTTLGTREAAEKMAQAMVERRMAACVQILGPITSTYWWEGRVETAQEWMCVCKTTEVKYPALEEAIRQLHDYDVPEVLAMPIVAGNKAYLAWIDAELSADRESISES